MVSVASTAYDVLPYAIDRLQSAGYQLVTVAECLGMEPYQNVGQAQTNDVRLYLCYNVTFLTPMTGFLELLDAWLRNEHPSYPDYFYVSPIIRIIFAHLRWLRLCSNDVRVVGI